MTPRRLIAAIVLLCAGYAVMASRVPPSMFPDAAGGFLVLDSMRRGAPLNHMREPDPADIARDRTYFYAMWSPGQYAVPAALMAAGLTLGDALRVISLVVPVLGLAAWFCFYRTLGVVPAVALWSCALIACTRAFNFNFVTYVGSDVYAFAVFPLLAALLYTLRASWLLVAAAPAAVVAGFFLKNSLAINLTVWLGVVMFVTSWRAPTTAAVWPRHAAVAFTSAAALYGISEAYTSRGWTPVSYAPSWSHDAADYVFSWAMPLTAATGVDDMLSRAFTFPGALVFDYRNSVPFLLALAVAHAVFLGREARVRADGGPSPAPLFTAAMATVFGLMLVTGSGASLFESRHYAIAGMVSLPLLLERTAAARVVPARVSLTVVLGAAAAYGLGSFASNWQRHAAKADVHSAAIELTHPQLTAPVLTFLRALDQSLPSGTNNVVVTPTPQFALEFSRTRVIATAASSDPLEKLRATRWQGHVDNLVVIAEPGGLTDEELAAWLDSFAGYSARNWAAFEADGFRFYVPGGQVVTPEWLGRLWRTTTRGAA